MISAANHVRVAHYAGLVEQSRLLATGRCNRRQLRRTESVTFHCGAGQVRVRTMQDGVCSIVYSGVIGDVCFANLRQNVVLATLGAKVLLIDMTGVLSTSVLVPPVPASLYPNTAPPGVVICREDQLSTWRQYAGDIAEHGIMRLVFLDSERELALLVAQSLIV